MGRYPDISRGLSLLLYLLYFLYLPFMFSAVIFKIHSVWWRLALFDFVKFHVTPPLVIKPAITNSKKKTTNQPTNKPRKEIEFARHCRNRKPPKRPHSRQKRNAYPHLVKTVSVPITREYCDILQKKAVF